MKLPVNETVFHRVWLVTIFGRRFGFERSTIYAGVSRYLDRWIIYAGGTLRLHRFTQGDDARAVHDHPWWFVTFPLGEYRELVYNPHLGDAVPYVNVVKPWRFHRRPALYRHRVLPMNRPVWTIVLTGYVNRRGRTAAWGFYPKPDEFVSYLKWKAYNDAKKEPA